MATRRAVCVALIAALAAVMAVAGAGAEALRTEVYSPWTRVAFVNGRSQVIRDLCVSGQCLIRLAPGVTAEQFDAMLRRHNARVLRAFPRYGLFLVSLPEGMTVRQGVAMWRAEPGVIDAAPDRIKYQFVTPNDPMYSRQWHWPKINAPAGWDMTTGSQSIVVAVIDSGADLDHEDLAGRWWINADEVPGNGIDDDGNGYVDDINGWDFVEDDNDPTPHPTDSSQHDCSHGTHVAGIIGALTNNGKGVAGHDWECRIMVLRVFDENGGGATESRFLAAINYAIDNGADVINMSLGGAYTSVEDALMQRARQEGIVVVAAAGNDDQEFTDDPNTWVSPICNDGPDPDDNWVLGVAATDQQDKKASFSNYDGSSRGTFVDVSAPGVSIWSTVIYDPDHGFDEAYEAWDGTSMATPVVSGLVALVRAAWPSLDPLAVINQIKQTCVNIDSLNPGYEGKLGAGRIDTAAAIGLDMPPGPPRGVIAADTPNDEGGSITVTWSRSLDDGGGANDVVEYVVYRCDSTTDANGNPIPQGNWTKLGTVPAGQRSYAFVDTPVPDHTPFWYKVSAKDASNETESQPAGPAEARDDLPPPPVQNLTAGDTQADDGGSISLSWSRYSAPADFQGFHIYRAESAFTRISQAELIADIPGEPDRTFYRDATTTDGVQYWYAVTAYDDEGNEIQEVEAVGPAVSWPNMMMSLPAGLSMIAIGAQTVETDMAALLGIAPEDLRLARWDPVQETYRTYRANPADPFLQQQPGRGFWIALPEPLMLNISGQRIEGDFTVSVVAGWNQLGNPFAHDLRWQGVTVRARGTVYGLRESNAAGIARDYAWTWDPYTSSYRLVSEYEGFGQKTIKQGYGFWFLAFENCELVLPDSAQAAAAREQAKRVKVDWKLKLVARCGQVADEDNYLGVSPQAKQLNGILSPPAAPGAVDLYFVNEGVEGRAAASFVEPGRQARWQVKVACAGLDGREVQVLWPDLSGLPRDVRPVLVDLATGQRVYMRTTSGYRFRVGQGEVERPLEIIAARASRHVQVRALAARPTATGVDVCFTLSAPAAVTVEVLNMAGRHVQQVVAGREMGAGPCRVHWNGTAASGVPVPAGRYLVQVTARTADGEQITRVAPVVIRK